MVMATAPTSETSEIIGSVTQLVLALGGLYAVVRLIVSVQLRLLEQSLARNKSLEDRIDELEAKLDQEQDNHRTCRQELHEHKLEASAQMAEMRAQIDMLTQQVNRPHRSTDPEGE